MWRELKVRWWDGRRARVAGLRVGMWDRCREVSLGWPRSRLERGGLLTGEVWGSKGESAGAGKDSVINIVKKVG